MSNASTHAENLPPWERVLSAAARLQVILPGTVLVGGTAAAIHVHHRRSMDADHVMVDLRQRFDEILAELEGVAGWKTARVKRPVMILGSLDGIQTGVRQLIRTAPLDVTMVRVEGGNVLLPTQKEILRIKARLVLVRNATRDYLDLAALSHRLGKAETNAALARFDEVYPPESDQSPLQQLLAQLAQPAPYDLADINLAEYKGLEERWHQWPAVAGQCQKVAIDVFDEPTPTPR